jgi:hypothetical protein
VNKLLPFLFKIFAIKLLLVLSMLFLVIPFAPGVLSNMVAWLETDGAGSALFIGTLFIVLTICRIISTLHLFSSTKVTVHRGIFHTTINEGVFTQLVEKLWGEYFHRADLTVRTKLKRNGLYITGEVPADTSNLDDLSSFLAKEMLKLTGFFGKIMIESHQV